MGIEVDDIHPLASFKKVRAAMLQAVADVAAMPNDNPLLDTCQLCMGGAVAPYARVRGFDMYRCGDCELIFCNPYPTGDQLHAIYNSRTKRLENELFLQTFDARVKIFLPRVDLLLKQRGQGRLLDIGSAVGVFLEALSRRAAPYEVTSCDLSADACNALRRFESVEVIEGDFMDLPAEGAYSVVTLWDTIEHVVDLNGLLEKVRGLLEPGGLFAFSTPNTASFEWHVAGARHDQLAPPTHVNLMNERSIRLLLDRHDFRVIEAHTLNASLDIGYVQKLVEGGEVEMGRLGSFLEENLQQPGFVQAFERCLVETRGGGNLLILAEA